LRLPQPEQSCDVCAGFTAMERLAAHAAFQALNVANWLHAAAWMLLAR
jgi:hypothetical protein